MESPEAWPCIELYVKLYIPALWFHTQFTVGHFLNKVFDYNNYY